MIRKARREQRLDRDPTPAEIRSRSEAIRSNWTDHERLRRSLVKPIAWMPPVLPATEFADATSDFELGAPG